MILRAILPLLLALIAGIPAWAAEPVSREELQKALEQRDRIIAELQKRLDALEGAKTPDQPAVPPAAPAPSAAATPAAEEDVALQALSRTLVERGVLLLPEWGVELSPAVNYSHMQSEGLVVVPVGAINTVVDRRLRDDVLEAALSLRLGLPWQSQVELRVPYSWKREALAFGGAVSSDQSAYHWGDMDLELSRQLFREHGWVPDLLAALDVRFPTGNDPFRMSQPDLANGSGFYGLRGRLTALKSQDPLAFFGTIAYTMNLPDDKPAGRVDPGETFGLSLGTVLAASPSTSLTLALANDFTGRTSVNRTSLPGSDRVVSVLQIGAAAVVARNVLTNFTLGVGLTADTPDYQFLLSLPVRF